MDGTQTVIILTAPQWLIWLCIAIGRFRRKFSKPMIETINLIHSLAYLSTERHAQPSHKKWRS